MTTKNFLRLLSPIIITGILLSLFPFGHTNALSGGDFKPGRIIDDVIFFNKDAMNVQQIQDFLNAKVPTCDRWHAGFTGSSGTVYNPPFTCLKEYNENPTTHENNIGRFNADGSPYQVPGGQSAAQIIYSASQTYSINPQVILTTLQKESGIVTDDWAASWQYKTAMGYACPDTAACDSTYYGFYNQVTSAAWQFRRYTTLPDNYNFKGGVTRYVQYNPSASCGGSNVYLENQATANLYNYTPYQPNAAALSVMNDTTAGGTVTCGAYGNRNFFWYFNKWFGSTYAPDFSWQIVSQQYSAGSAYMIAGTNQTTTVTLKVKNMGNITWQNSGPNPVYLGTSQAFERQSNFYNQSWPGRTRAALLTEASVAPGDIGTFTFTVSTPNQAGIYYEHFDLVSEGRAWMPDIGLSFYFNVSPQIYSWQIVSQQYPTGTASGVAGTELPLILTVKNTGNMTWSRDGATPVHLGTSNSIDRQSQAYNPSWVGTTRPANLTEATVAPGAVGTFSFKVTMPKTPGIYREYFNLVAENVTWMPNLNMNFYLESIPAVYSWQIVSQQYSSNSATMTTSSSQTLTVKAKNTGNVTWFKSGQFPVYLGTSNPNERRSSFYDPSWPGYSRAATFAEDSVPPGAVGTFSFKINAPTTTGIYREYFNLVAENFTWMPNPNMNFYLNIVSL